MLVLSFFDDELSKIFIALTQLVKLWSSLSWLPFCSRSGVKKRTNENHIVPNGTHSCSLRMNNGEFSDFKLDH